MNQRARKVAARFVHFGGDEIGSLPAAVRKENRDERGAHGGNEIEGYRPIEHRTHTRTRRIGGRVPETHEYQCGDGCDFHHHQDALHRASGADAEAIDDRQACEHERCNPAVRNRDRRHGAKIFCERDRDGCHSARLNYEQQNPSIEKSDRGMIGLTQVGVLAAGAGHARGEFRIHQRAEKRDAAANCPCAKNERGSVDLPRDDVGIDENSGADDAAHDDHRGVEEPEARDELARRGHFLVVDRVCGRTLSLSSKFQRLKSRVLRGGLCVGITYREAAPRACLRAKGKGA